jgi:hypothetical protein
VGTADECKNCGAPVAGRYCSACGQKADVRILSLGRFLADAIGDLYNLDSRMWRSLGTLTFKPGRLTHRYLEGQRARYTPPFRMYIVTSVAFFLAVSLIRFESRAPAEGPAAESVDAAVAAAPDDAGLTPIPGEDAAPEPAEPEVADDGAFKFTVDDGAWGCRLGGGLSPTARARLEAACRKIEADSGASFVRAFVDNVPVMMLVFIPIVAAIMNALYLFSRRKYVEHLLFFVHVHTFFFFTALITVLVARGAELATWLERPVRIVEIVAWGYFPVYLYLAMRYLYRQGHALTSVKYVALGGGYFLALMLTLLGMVLYTAMTL